MSRDEPRPTDRGRTIPARRRTRTEPGGIPVPTRRIAAGLIAAYETHGDSRQLRLQDLPSKDESVSLLKDLLALLFPSWWAGAGLTPAGLRRRLERTLPLVRARLGEESRGA